MADRRRRAMVPEDLFRLRWAMEPAIDDAGTRVAYVVAGFDADADRLDCRVHVVDVISGATASLPYDAPIRLPRWSPDGRRLAVRSLVAGRWLLAVFDEVMAEPSGIDLDGDVEAFDWAPDGIRLVCQVWSGPPASRRLWLVDVTTADARPLGADLAESWGGVWAPDGDRVAFASRTEDGSAGVWTADPRSPAQPALLVAGWADVQAAAWSPDGTTLALIVHPDAHAPWANRQLWLVAASTGERRQLGAVLDRSIGQVVRGDDERGLGPPSLAWTPDGTAILALVADGGTSSIVAFDVDSEQHVVDRLPAASGAMLEFDVARRSGTVAYTWSDPLTPGELGVLFTDGGRRRCSDLAAPLRRAVDLARTEPVSCETGDGRRVEGWLTLPPGAAEGANPPLVLQVHGGPHYPVGERFCFDAQRLAAAGVALLRANPRGSQGYGEGFAAAVRGDWGGGDVDDLLAILDEVVATHPIDRQRIAVIGESYGAFVALIAIARSDRFACAVAENGVADLDAAVPRQPAFWRAELALDVDNDVGVDGAVTERRVLSPVERAPQMANPLLLVHAEGDEVNPIAQSEAMAAALAECGRRAELVRTPGTDHFANVTGPPQARLDKVRLVDAFLRQHLETDVMVRT